MKFDEFIESDMVAFLNTKLKELRAAEPVREEEFPLLYTGKDYRRDLDVAIAANDLSKAKSIFEACKVEYGNASGEKKKELFKTLEDVYIKIKEFLKSRRKQSLEGEISLFEEEGPIREEKVLGKLFAPVKEPLPTLPKETVATSPTWAETNLPVVTAKPLPVRGPEELIKKLEESLKPTIESLVERPLPDVGIHGRTWTSENGPPVEQVPTPRLRDERLTAERLMEDRIKERINESAGIIKLALEKKDLNRAIIEYNKLKETYALIPLILAEEKAEIYSKILLLYNRIKQLEQEKLMTRMSNYAQRSLTEEEVVDKLTLALDRTQAFILNKDLPHAVDEYQQATDLFDLLPDSLPEIKKRFLVDLARVYQGLQNVNNYLQKKSPKSLFDLHPEKVLKKYTPQDPLEEIKKAIFKIEKYTQAKALKSAMLEFNKIKALSAHLSPLAEETKKELFSEVKGLFDKINELRKEGAVEKSSPSTKMTSMEDEIHHLDQVKEIHKEIQSLYPLLASHDEISTQQKILEIEHKIALLPSEEERERLRSVTESLRQKAHISQQTKRLTNES